MSDGPPLQPDSARFEPSSNTQRANQYSTRASQPVLLQPGPPPAEAQSLPATYGIPLFELLVVDPYHVFISWEITPGQLGSARDYFGENDFAKRRLLASFYSVASPYEPICTTELFGDTGRWFVQPGAPGVELRAVLAFESGSSRLPLNSAGPVSVPRDAPVEPAQFVELTVRYERLADGRLVMLGASRAAEAAAPPVLLGSTIGLPYAAPAAPGSLPLAATSSHIGNLKDD